MTTRVVFVEKPDNKSEPGGKTDYRKQDPLWGVRRNKAGPESNRKSKQGVFYLKTHPRQNLQKPTLRKKKISQA